MLFMRFQLVLLLLLRQLKFSEMYTFFKRNSSFIADVYIYI